MRKKLINVCEDLTVGGQVLHIKELEGKWLTDEEEYKSNFVAKFRVTGENVMKNRYSRFEDPDGILLLRL